MGQSNFPAQVYVQTTATGRVTGAADAAAALQVDSTTQGVLVPRLTTVQRNAIPAPPDGLIVFDTTAEQLAVVADGAWVLLPGGSTPGSLHLGDNQYITFGDDNDAFEGYSSLLNALLIQSASATNARSASLSFGTGNVLTDDAIVGQASGNLLIATGGSDCVDAGGTGGGSGDLTIGTGSAISPQGLSGDSGDLRFVTGDSDDGNSGSIFITTGDAGTTRGAINLSGGVVGEGAGTAISGSPALALTSLVAYIDATGGSFNPTLGAGANGQVLHLVMIATSGGNTATINANINGTSLVFAAVGEGATLVYDNTTNNWSVVGTTATFTP